MIEYRYEDPFFVVRRDRTGQDDGTPVYATNQTTDEPYFGMYQPPLATSSGRNVSGTGTANTKRSMLYCPAEVDVTSEDQIDILGERWRIDSLVRFNGMTTSHTELEIHRAEGS